MNNANREFPFCRLSRLGKRLVDNQDTYFFHDVSTPGFPICLPQMAPLNTRRPPSARNSCSSQHRPASEAVSSARGDVRGAAQHRVVPGPSDASDRPAPPDGARRDPGRPLCDPHEALWARPTAPPRRCTQPPIHANRGERSCSVSLKHPLLLRPLPANQLPPNIPAPTKTGLGAQRISFAIIVHHGANCNCSCRLGGENRETL